MQYHDLLKVSDDGKGLTVKGHPCEVSENGSIFTLDIQYAMDISVHLSCSTNFDASKVIKYLVNLNTSLRPHKPVLPSEVMGGMAWAMMHMGFDALYPSYTPYILSKVMTGNNYEGASLVYMWALKQCCFLVWTENEDKWLSVRFPHSLKVRVRSIAEYTKEAFAK